MIALFIIVLKTMLNKRLYVKLKIWGGENTTIKIGIKI